MEGQSGLSELSIILWVSAIQGCLLSGDFLFLFVVCLLCLKYSIALTCVHLVSSSITMEAGYGAKGITYSECPNAY